MVKTVDFFFQTYSIPWLVMFWQHKKPRLQQPCCWASYAPSQWETTLQSLAGRISHTIPITIAENKMISSNHWKPIRKHLQLEIKRHAAYIILFDPVVSYWVTTIDGECDTNQFINSMAPGGSSCDFKNVIYNLALPIGGFRSSHDNALRWTPQKLTLSEYGRTRPLSWRLMPDISGHGIGYLITSSGPCLLQGGIPGTCAISVLRNDKKANIFFYLIRAGIKIFHISKGAPAGPARCISIRFQWLWCRLILCVLNQII